MAQVMKWKSSGVYCAFGKRYVDKVDSYGKVVDCMDPGYVSDIKDTKRL